MSKNFKIVKVLQTGDLLFALNIIASRGIKCICKTSVNAFHQQRRYLLNMKNKNAVLKFHLSLL